MSEHVVEFFEMVEVAVGDGVRRPVSCSVRTLVSRLLRVTSPVRESLLAWVCESSRPAASPNAPMPVGRRLRRPLTDSDGGEPSSLVTWNTPTEFR